MYPLGERVAARSPASRIPAARPCPALRDWRDVLERHGPSLRRPRRSGLGTGRAPEACGGWGAAPTQQTYQCARSRRPARRLRWPRPPLALRVRNWPDREPSRTRPRTTPPQLNLPVEPRRFAGVPGLAWRLAELGKADHRARAGAARSGRDVQKTPPERGSREEERMMGLEPTTFCMASRRSSQLSYIRGTAEV